MNQDSPITSFRLQAAMWSEAKAPQRRQTCRFVELPAYYVNISQYYKEDKAQLLTRTNQTQLQFGFTMRVWILWEPSGPSRACVDSMNYGLHWARTESIEVQTLFIQTINKQFWNYHKLSICKIFRCGCQNKRLFFNLSILISRWVRAAPSVLYDGDALQSCDQQ